MELMQFQEVKKTKWAEGKYIFQIFCDLTFFFFFLMNPAIAYLDKLEVLKCEGNKIKEIPEAIAECKKIRSFNISSNKVLYFFFAFFVDDSNDCLPF